MIDCRTSVYLIVAFATISPVFGQSPATPAARTGTEGLVQFMEAHCFDCHGHGSEEGGLAIDALLDTGIPHHAEQWETIVRKLAARQMPPAGELRPDESTYDDVISQLVTELDRNAAERPNPGRTETFRRLNRTEYQNAISDLLALDVDLSQLLPSDEASHGFDNITVTGLSPVLLDRYVSAAQEISRLAIGDRAVPAAEKTYRIRPDITQDTHIAGTPIGTRGGTVLRHNFPQDGEYEIQVRLMRDRNEELEGLRGTYQLDVLLDRDRVELFTIAPPPRGSSDKSVDANLKTRVEVSAGPHDVGVVFPKNPSSLLETVRQPLNVHFNYYRHPRIEPAVYQVTIRGPFNGKSGGDTPSRRRIFVRYPRDKDDEVECADRIILNLMRRAYCREVTRADLKAPMEFFHEGNRKCGFDAGIERALSAVLVSPHFLFRIEREPEGIPADTAYQLPPLELVSRLSFFLWSSIPDDELRKLAMEKQIQQPEVLEAQVVRMLADERSESLIRNFAAQWLYLRNLESVIPDMRLFPDFDDNLRQALRRETELFFESIVREDRSVLDLIKADYTYLNERLAKHYGIPHVYGSRFRRVALDQESRRGGLLRHGSILTVTSYATRTSPVIRGHWVLENLLGSPPPPPPPNVPALEDNTVSASLSVRERLGKHRAHAACASCHNLIDPVGFALENFDAVGRWRETENSEPVFVAGGLPDGSEFVGVSGLEQALLKRPELFVQTLTEKLMTFALGRGLEHYDAPAVRRVVRDSEREDFRFSEIVLGIAKSVPFQMRKSQ
jgi:mono/diheme cytochrome c family protein